MLQQLNNEAVLLMYLADELPADDRAEVDHVLATDPAFRAELDRLQQAQELFETGMARLDGAQPLSGDAAAVRRITAAMRRHALERAASAPAPMVMRRGLRYPWWAYPTVAAASIILAFLTWWGHGDAGLMGLPPVSPTGPQFVDDSAARQADELASNFANPNPTQSEQRLASLDSTERQIAELSRADQVPAFPSLDVPNE